MHIKCLTIVLLLHSPLLLANPQDQWWQHLQSLCGKAFDGELRQAPAGDTSFSDMRLVMHVRDCQADRIRIPFVVGENRSRT